MKQLVLPIKDSNVLHEVQDTLLNNFQYGRRNYTIFQVYLIISNMDDETTLFSK